MHRLIGYYILEPMSASLFPTWALMLGEEMGRGDWYNLAYLKEMDIPTTTQLRVHPTPTHTLILACIRRNTTAAQKTISRPLSIVYAFRLLHLRRRWMWSVRSW